MATVLNQIVQFVAVAPGATVTLPNSVNKNGIPCLPDIIGRDNPAFSITTPVVVGSITVTNHSPGAADCNVWLWQQYSTDRAYGGVNPPLLNMTPQPFIIGGAAAATGGGGSGGTQYVFVFRPGGLTVDNVYATWAPLVAAANLVQGQKIIEFDDTFGALVVPAGAWDMTDCIWSGDQGIQRTITVVDGAVFTQLRSITTNLGVVFTGTTPCVSDLLGSDGPFTFDNSSSLQCTGAGPFISCNDPGGAATVSFTNLSSLNTGTVPAISVDTIGAHVNVIAGEVSGISRDTLGSTVGGAAVVVGGIIASSAQVSQDQPSAPNYSVLNLTLARWNPTAIVTSAHAASANELVLVDPTGGPVPVSLPPAFNHIGQQIVVKNTSSSTNAIIVSPAGGNTIDGTASFTIASAFGSVILASDGISDWSVIATDLVATGSGSTQYAFVYQPGGVTAANVFATWPALVTAVNAVAGPKIIYFDDSIVSPCPIPAGVWPMTHATWVGDGSLVNSVDIADGANFPHLRNVGERLHVRYTGTAVLAPVNDMTNGEIFSLDGESHLTTSGSGPLISALGAGTVNVVCTNNGHIKGGTVPVVSADSATITLIVVSNNGQIDDNTLASTIGGAQVALIWAGAAGSASEDQPAVAGGVFPNNQTILRLTPQPIITAGVTANPNDVVQCDPTGGGFGVILPLAFNNRGNTVIVKNVTASTNTITVLPPGGDTIDGGGSTLLTLPFQSASFVSDGANNWLVTVAEASGGSGGTQYVFVFRPGGVTAGNVFATWPALVTATLTVPGQKVIEFDDSLGAVNIPGGSWDMTDCIWEAHATGAVQVTIPDGVKFTNLRTVSTDVSIVFTGAVPPVTDITGTDTFTFDSGATIQCTGAGPFFSLLDPVGTATIVLKFANDLITGTAPIISVDNVTASVNIVVGTLCNVQDNTLAITLLGGALETIIVNSSATVSQTQPAATAATIANFTRARWDIGPIVTGAVAATANQLVETNPTGGPVTVSLPPALGLVGQQIVIKNTTSSTNGITALPAGADTIDGFAAYATTLAFDAFTLTSDGVSNWVVTAGIQAPAPVLPAPGPFFVFFPGGGPSHDNVFATWPEVVTACGAFSGLKTILFNTNAAPCVIPAGGPYDMTDVTWSGDLSVPVNVEIQDGAQLAKLRAITSNLVVTYSGTGALAPINDLTGDEALIVSRGAVITTSGSGPMINASTPASAASVVFLDSATVLTGSVPTILVSQAVPFGVGAGIAGTIQADTIATSDPGALVHIENFDSSSIIDETQPGIGVGQVDFVNLTNHRMTILPLQTSGISLTSGNVFLPCNPTGAGFTVALPAAFNNRGMAIVVKNVSASSNAINVVALGGDTVDNTTNINIQVGEGVLFLISDGVSNWAAVSSRLNPTPIESVSFAYVATGAEGSSFTITIPATMPSVNYTVQGANAGVAVILAYDFPTIGRTTTSFPVITTSNLTLGDTINFSVVSV